VAATALALCAGYAFGTETDVTPLPASDVDALLSGTVGAGIVFDHYVSNPLPGGPVRDNATIQAFNSPFTGFLSPLPENTTYDADTGAPGQQLPPAVGVIVERSVGPVEFADHTSPDTSDIVCPAWAGDGTLTVRFVSPANAAQRAVVSRVALRFGSVAAPAQRATLFDIDGNALADVAVPFDESYSSKAGWASTDGGIEVPRIHGIVFYSTMAGPDIWVLGSFTLAPTESTIDLAWHNFTIPPCRSDWDHNGVIQPADIGSFISDWFTSLTTGTLAGDFDRNGVVTPADVGSFVSAWFASLSGPCPL